MIYPSNIWSLFNKKEKTLAFGLLVIAMIYFGRAFAHIWGYSTLAIDLTLRYHEIQALFIEGRNIFFENNQLLYPPSFLFLLTPLIGFFSYYTVEYVWFIIQLLSVAVIIKESYHLLKNKNPDIGLKYIFLVLVSILAWHSIYQGMGIGQVTNLLMALFLWSFNSIEGTKHSALRKVAIIYSYTLILGKFTIFLPVFVFLIFKQKHRPYIYSSVLLNIIISLGVIFYYELSITEYITVYISKFGSGFNSGSFDLFSVSQFLELPPLLIYIISISTLLIPLFVGLKNLNTLRGLAITFIVARLWIYHGLYDNIMLILVALYLVSIKNIFPISFFCVLSAILILPSFIWNTSFFGLFVQISFSASLLSALIWCYKNEPTTKRLYNHSGV